MLGIVSRVTRVRARGVDAELSGYSWPTDSFLGLFDWPTEANMARSLDDLIRSVPPQAKRS